MNKVVNETAAVKNFVGELPESLRRALNLPDGATTAQEITDHLEGVAPATRSVGTAQIWEFVRQGDGYVIEPRKDTPKPDFAAENLAVALRHAAAGLAVFPCGTNKKPKPNIKWRDVSTSNPDTIKFWWRKWPDAITGINLGKSDLVVIDTDRHDPAKDGIVAFTNLEISTEVLPERPITNTYSKGQHHYFRQPNDGGLLDDSRVEGKLGNGKGSLPDGIDVRGNGGYVIAAGSTIAAGSALSDGTLAFADGSWVADPDAPDLAESLRADTIPALPMWLATIIRTPKVGAALPSPVPAEAPSIRPAQSGARERAFAEAALEGMRAEVAGLTTGNRNNALNGIAYRLGRLVARGWLSGSEVESTLVDACASNGLLRDDGPKQCRDTIRSGLNSGKGKPHEDLKERANDDANAFIKDCDQPYDPETGEIIEEKKGKPFLCFWAGEANESASVPFLVYNTIPQTGKGLISGQWGTYKTFTAIELSAAIMTGTEIFGSEVDRPGGVLFYACEGESEVAIRLKAAIEKRGLSMSEAPFAWLTPEKIALNLRDPKSVEAFVARLKLISIEMQKRFNLPLVMVIIDTVIATAGFTKPGDENDATVCAVVLNDGLGKIGRETESFAFGIDHFGKVADTGTRGGSPKEDNSDCILACLGDKDLCGAVKNTRVAVRKARGGEAGREYPFTVHKIETGGCDRKGRPNTTLTIEWGTPVNPATAADGKGKDGWTKALRTLQRALTNVIIDQGADMRPFPDGPVVRAVALDVVRAEFYKTYPATGETKAQQQDAKKKAFNRNVKEAQATSLIGVREIEDINRVWIISRDMPENRDMRDRDNAS